MSVPSHKTLSSLWDCLGFPEAMGSLGVSQVHSQRKAERIVFMWSGFLKGKSIKVVELCFPAFFLSIFLN